MSKEQTHDPFADDEEISEIYQGQPVFKKRAIKTDITKLSSKSSKLNRPVNASISSENISKSCENDESLFQNNDANSMDKVSNNLLKEEKTPELSTEHISNDTKDEKTAVHRTRSSRRSTSSRYNNMIYDDPFEESSDGSSFDPQEDSFESLENTDNSDEEFLIGKFKKKKSARKVKSRRKSNRKPSSGSRPTKRFLQPVRKSQRSKSQTSYVEESSDDDYPIVLREGQPYSGRKDLETLPNKTAKGRSTKSGRPQRAAASCSSYDMSFPSDFTSSDEEQMTLLEGQPMVVKHSCKKTMKSIAEKPQFENQKQVTSEKSGYFLVQKDYMDIIKNLPFTSTTLKNSLCIWKLTQNLLQKFVQVNSSEIFKSTNNYLGFYEENRMDYMPVDVVSINHNAEMVKIVGGSNNYETEKATNNIDLKLPKGVKRRGRPRSTQNVLTPVKRKNSNEGTGMPRKRGRPRKESLPALEPQNKHSLNENSPPQVETSTLSEESFCIYLKQLLVSNKEQSNLHDLNCSDSNEDENLEKKLFHFEENLLKQASLNHHYIVDLMSRPVIHIENCSPGHLCEATKDNTDVAADKLIVFSGNCYSRETLFEVPKEETESKESRYFVSSDLATLSNTFHQLYHYKFHLSQNCFRKLKSNRERLSINHQDNSTCNGSNSEAFVSPNAENIDDEISALMEDVISKVTLNCDYPSAASNREVSSGTLSQIDLNNLCKDATWVDQNFTELSNLLKRCEKILKDVT